MFNNISYNVVIERFKLFADGHYLIKRFTHGQVDQTDLDKDQQFPWMHVAPVEVRAAAGARLFTFDVIFADIPRDKEDKTDYQKESISDCIRLAEDLLSEIQNGQTVFGSDVEVEGESTITPFIEEWTHTLSGCTLALTISVPNNYSACDIPADWAIGGGSPSTPPSPLPGIILRVNTVDNVNQHLLDLTAGANITITDLGDGRVKFDATGDVGTNWGSIGGLLSNQLDLQAALDLKADISSLGAAAFSNDYTDLDNLPTIPSELDDLSDVNAPTPSNGQVLTWNGTEWVASTPSTGSGTVTSVGLSVPAPANAALSVSGSPVTTSGTLAITANGIAAQYIDGTGALQNFPAIPKTVGDLIAGTQKGDLLEWDGSKWVIIPGLALDALNDVALTTPSNGQTLQYNGTSWVNVTPSSGGTVTSVALTMPTAFAVTGSPITTAGTLAVSGAGTTDQYIRGDGSLANFPSTGGGGGQIFYFNGNVSQGTIGGNAYYELGTDAGTGPAANFTRATTGVIARFITDVGSPNHLVIPSGVWTIDVYLSETGGGANHAEILAKLYTYDGTNFTLVAVSPVEQITNGNVLDLYTFTISVPNTVTLATDRVHIEFDIQNTNGKTVTLYTEDSTIGEVHSTYAIGLSSLNGLTANTQTFATGTSGTDFGISSAGSVHTFNLPTAGASARGALSSADWSTFNSKVSTSRSISTSSPLSGGGDLSADRTLSIADAAADGTTKGAAAFTAADFNSSSGVISIDYANGQKASAAQPGFLSAADWSTFNSKPAGDSIAYASNPNISQAANSTAYWGISGSLAPNTSENARIIVMPCAGTIKNLYIRIGALQSSGGTMVFTLRKNAADTAITITFANADGSNVTKSDTTNTVSVAAGDTISIKGVNNAPSSASGTFVSFSLLLERS